MKNCLLFICVVFVVSCVTQSSDDKIKDAFSEYVNQNFDDPKSFVEVVTVKLDDTLSVATCKQLVSTSKEPDSLYSDKRDSIRNVAINYMDIAKKAKLSKSERDEVLRYLLELSDANRKMIDLFEENRSLPVLEKEIQAMRDTAIYIFSIKVRNKYEGKLKIETFYAKTDTTFSNIEVLKDNKLENVGGFFWDLYSKVFASQQIHKDMVELYKNEIYNYRNIIWLLEPYYKP